MRPVAHICAVVLMIGSKTLALSVLRMRSRCRLRSAVSIHRRSCDRTLRSEERRACAAFVESGLVRT